MITTFKEALMASNSVVFEGFTNLNPQHLAQFPRGGGVFLTGPRGEMEFDLYGTVIVSKDGTCFVGSTDHHTVALKFNFHTLPRNHDPENYP